MSATTGVAGAAGAWTTGAAGGGDTAAGARFPCWRYQYPPAPPPSRSTANSTNTPPLDRFGCSFGRSTRGAKRRPLAGTGVTGGARGATCSVGSSAESAALGRGRSVIGPLRPAVTGCSGHTAVANSSIVVKRCAGSLAMARCTAAPGTWDVAPHVARGGRILEDVLVEVGVDRVAAERELSRDQAVAHHAQRVLVGAAVHRLALGLLGRHVMGRADDHPGAGEAARGLQRLRDAEVGQHDPAVVVEQDVRRLHVAVHDATLVGVPQRAPPQHALDESIRAFSRRRPRTIDVLHSVVEAALALDAVDRDDVGVVGRAASSL
jgi:hypothetical protein